MQLTFLSLLALASTPLILADPLLTSFPNSLTLSTTFDPIKAAYWTSLPHHRRTPFSVSPDGKSAYLAYLDATYKSVVVQQVDTSTFAAVGTPVSWTGYEAGGLVAQNDGFAVMITTDATGTTDLPPVETDYVVNVVRYKDGAEAWRTPMNGPGVHTADGLTVSPDANGDLVYSETAGLYAAYFVVTAYTGDASGHFGDSIQYVDDTGALQTIAGASSTFGCSHNTGIGLEAADAAPFASICAEDQGDIWLNTDTQYMSGVKIANENTTNGVSGEPMGGMSGSYSNLALFPDTTNYVFAWQSRGAVDLTLNAWMGTPYTQCSPRWLNHNVAIATMSSKNKLTGAEASSTVGAASGDDQINWITESSTEDHQNVHVAALSSNLSVVSWETLTSPDCQPVPLGCTGTYAGTSFQFVDSAGAKQGAVVSSTDVTVGGDMAVVGDKVCWPYVDQTWDLSAAKDSGMPVSKMSFACVGTSGSSAAVSSSAVASSSSAVASSSSVAEVATSSAAAVVTSAQAAVVSTTSSAAAIISSSSVAAIISAPTSSLEALSTSSSAQVSSEAPISTSAIGSLATSTSIPASSSAPSVAESPPAVSASASASNTQMFSFPIPTGTRTKHHGHTSKHGYHQFTTFATSVRPSSTGAVAGTGTGEAVDGDDECEWY